jgi:hypothetical protein
MFRQHSVKPGCPVHQGYCKHDEAQRPTLEVHYLVFLLGAEAKSHWLLSFTNTATVPMIVEYRTCACLIPMLLFHIHEQILVSRMATEFALKI